MPHKRDIERLIIEHERRLQKLKEQQARFGIKTDAHILTEIEDIETALANLQAQLTGLAERPRINPYRGLAAFREADAAFFFGREQFTNRLVATVRHKPLVAVLGPSGSGKSSVIFAGLIPRLREAGTWLIAPLRPGHNPFRNLASALLPLYEPNLDKTDQMAKVSKLAAYLRNGDISVDNVMANIFQAQPQARQLLLIADQFEELYTYCANSTDQQQFLEQLLQALFPASGPEAAQSSHLVLTLRADFLGEALQNANFGDALQNAIELLRPMSPAEMRLAVEKPAVRQGVGFEAGLIERILAAVSDEPGKLPLLEFALTALWNQQIGNQLTHAVYDAIGQVEGALSQYAEHVYNDELTPAEQGRARWIFGQMVRPGNGTGNTRRLARRPEMTGEADWALVRKLATARLVVTDRDAAGEETAEIIHEALIQDWKRLRDWLTEDRAFRLWQDRLRFALNQWQATGQDEGVLLRGAPLSEAETWLADREPDLSPLDRQFIRASINLREAREAEKAARHQRELDQQRALTAEQRKRVRVLAVASVVAFILAVLAIVFGVQAQRSATEARHLALAASAQQALSENNTDLAIALALEANNIDPPLPVAQVALAAAAYYTPGARKQLVGHTDRVTGVAFNPTNGRVAVSGSADNSLIVWNLETGAIIRRLVGHTADVTSVVFSPDGRTILSGSADNDLILWAADSGQIIRRFEGHTQPVNSVAIDPTGRMALSGADDGTVIGWNIANGAELFRKPCAAPVSSVRFSPDGQLFAAGTADNAAWIWNTKTGEQVQHILSVGNHGVAGLALTPDNNNILIGAEGYGPGLFLRRVDNGGLIQQFFGHNGGNTQVALSSDGQTAVTGSYDDQLILWNLARSDNPDEAKIQQFSGHTDDITSVAFSPDDRQILSGSADKTLRLWDVSGGAETRRFSGFVGFALSPDGRAVASSQDGNTPVLLDATTGNLRHFAGNATGLTSLAFSPDGRTVFSGDWSGVIHLWDVGQGTLDKNYRLHPNGINSIALSADGRYGLSGSYGPPGWPGGEALDSLLLLWNVETGQVEQRFVGHTGVVRSVAISADGRLALSGGDDTTVRLWDTQTGELLQNFTGHTAKVYSVIFGPGDKTVLSAGDDQTIRQWDLATGREKRRFTGHTMAILSIALSPNGQTLLSGSDDGSLRLWQLETGVEIGHFSGHQQRIKNVAFSAEGQFIWSRSDDRTIRQWQIQPQISLTAWTCHNRYVRELTCIERRQYVVEPLCDERGEPPVSGICQSGAADAVSKLTEDKNEIFERKTNSSDDNYYFGAGAGGVFAGIGGAGRPI